MARLGASFTRVGGALHRTRSSRLALAVVVVSGALPVALNPGMAGTLAAGPRPAGEGQFETAFTQPGADCPRNPDRPKTCKPTPATVVPLAHGRVPYRTRLAGTQNIALHTPSGY